MNVVTTFSPRGWNVYGKRFVDSFLAKWPARCHLHVFYEGSPPAACYPDVRWHDLLADKEHQKFVATYSDPKWNHPVDPNMQSVRFCHKVFAITSPELPWDDGWRVWIDADVVTTAEVSQQLIDEILPASKSLSFLGRTGDFRGGAQPAYTECGFVGYNLGKPKVLGMLDSMRHSYTSGELFSYGLYNWHDSYVFDHWRTRLNFAEEDVLNLSKGIKETHVWPHTLLAKVMQHQKGPRRKLQTYGGTA